MIDRRLVLPEPFPFGDGRTALVADGPTATEPEAEPDLTLPIFEVLDPDGVLRVFTASGSASWPLAERDAEWDGGAAEKRVREWAGVDGDDPSDSAWTKYGSAHFWTDPDAKDKLGGYKLPFCDVIDGKVTAIPKGVFGAAGAIQGSRGGVKIPSADVDAVKAKIAGYYAKMAKQFKDDKITPPWEDDAAAARAALSTLSPKERRRVDGDNEVTDPEVLAAMVASAFEARGGLEALKAARAAGGITAAVNPDGTVEPAPFHQFMCIEGVRTDDGRELMYGAGRYPDLPVSERLLIEDDGGHWGAVTCGRIDTMEAREVGTAEQPVRLHYATGMFGSDPNGQLAELMVAEQTQRFVSIDPRDITAEEIIVNRSVIVDGVPMQDPSDEYDCWWRFTDYVIGAATIVPMPAYPQAVITLADVPLPASPIAMESAPPTLPAGEVIRVVADDDGDEDDPVLFPAEVAASATVTLEGQSATTSTATTGPPSWFFDDPGFELGDPRLVLQADEVSYACPLTVDDPDPETGYRRVYGHVAWWNCDHTGFPGQHVKPPHSKARYAYYLTGPGVECADGTRVTGVGNITMGCGHAPMTTRDGDRTRSLTPAEVTAHYDGGYGAIQAAVVRAGEDAFGPWVAGYIPNGVSETEIAKLMTLNMSGDWREIGGHLEMIACLAVPVPGFPVRRELTASGAPKVEAYDQVVGYQDETAVAMVAAGIVRRVSPEKRIASLELRVAGLTAMVDQLAAERDEARLVARRSEYGLDA